jgi:transcriptional regulator with XRE-family HTH domain
VTHDLQQLTQAAQPSQSGEATPDGQVARLGLVLRRERRNARLTVEALSRRASVSAGLISQLERGRGNPSFLTLSRLAEGLGIPLGAFVQGPEGSPGKVVRATERKKLVMPEDHLVYELLTPTLRGALEMLRTQVPPGWTNRERPFAHTGEECVHLVRGSLQVTVGEERFGLDEGDSITYDASTPHWWLNPTDTPAVIVGAVTPPSF